MIYVLTRQCVCVHVCACVFIVVPQVTMMYLVTTSYVCVYFPGPVFVVQWLFDEAQLTVDNIHLTGQPVQEGQWRYIQNLGNELRNTLKDVP